MTSRDFCFWLQGYFEVHGIELDADLSAEQCKCVQKHLALVFKHEIDPSMGPPEHQAELNEVHEGKEKKPPRADGPFGPLLRC